MQKPASKVLPTLPQLLYSRPNLVQKPKDSVHKPAKPVSDKPFFLPKGSPFSQFVPSRRRLSEREREKERERDDFRSSSLAGCFSTLVVARCIVREMHRAGKRSLSLSLSCSPSSARFLFHPAVRVSDLLFIVAREARAFSVSVAPPFPFVPRRHCQ